jgi:hypothetical protein
MGDHVLAGNMESVFMGAIVHDFVSRMWPVRLGALLLPAESVRRIKDTGQSCNPLYPESSWSFCQLHCWHALGRTPPLDAFDAS